MSMSDNRQDSSDEKKSLINHLRISLNKSIKETTTIIENLMLFKGGTTLSKYFAISPLYKPKSNKGKAIW